MKKIGLIVLSLVLALGLVGAAFALWSSPASATINATMGNVQVGIAGLSNAADTGTSLGSGWYSGVTTTVTNGYPGDVINLQYEIGNIGSLPVNMGLNYVPFGSGAAIFANATTKFVVTGQDAGTYNDYPTFLTAITTGTWASGAIANITETVTLDPGLSSLVELATGGYVLTATGTESP